MEQQESDNKSVPTPAKVNILGVGISAIDLAIALDQIEAWIENSEREYVSVCTVHTVMMCQSNPQMREAVNGAGLATPDGMPLVWLANREADTSVKRVYGPDIMLALCARSVRSGYKHYFFGGEEGVPEQLAKSLSERFPGLAVAGSYSPPFLQPTTSEQNRIIDDINNAEPDIVWVGLGTPKQDLWMLKHRPKLDAAVLIAVGAAFDFHTNRIPQAPLWMQRNGLEWLYRLIQEPKRLWYRYLIYNPLFLVKVAEQKVGLRKYQL